MKAYTLVKHNGTFFVKRYGLLVSQHTSRKRAEAVIRILYLQDFGTILANRLE